MAVAAAVLVMGVATAIRMAVTADITVVQKFLSIFLKEKCFYKRNLTNNCNALKIHLYKTFLKQKCNAFYKEFAQIHFPNIVW